MWRVNYMKICFLFVGALVAGFIASTPAAAVPPILVGIVEDVTGYFADGGRAERDAAIMCIEEWNEKGGINGRKIEYVFRDNAGDPTKAATIAKEFVNLGVVGVEGGSSTTVGLAEAAVFVPAQVPHMICSLSSKFWDLKGPDGKWYVFSFVGSEPVAIEAAWVVPVIKYMANCKKVAILHVNILWGRSVRDMLIKLFNEKYAAKKIEVVGTVEMELKADDASKELMRIKALNPDVVLSAMFPQSYKAWFRARHDFNYYPPDIGPWGQAESVYLSSEPKFLYNFYGASDFDGSKKIALEKLDKFKKRFGYAPIMYWAPGYDAMNILLTAIKNVGTDRVAVRDWIATKSKGMPLVSGNKSAVCRFEEGSPYFYSSKYPTDMAYVYIDKEGKMKWLD
ncbi:MAG: ABC transporter substrate-binding protein [Thermodesulfobacteriota bacterium]